MQSSVNNLGRYVVVALVLIIGVVGLAMCADALEAEGAHLCCGGASNSAPLEHAVRRVWAVIALTAALALPLFVLTASGTRETLESATSSLTPLRLAPLRI